jgi:hypothetical protein
MRLAQSYALEATRCADLRRPRRANRPRLKTNLLPPRASLMGFEPSGDLLDAVVIAWATAVRDFVAISRR